VLKSDHLDVRGYVASEPIVHRSIRTEIIDKHFGMGPFGTSLLHAFEFSILGETA
jgi:hypothetical protein